MGSANKLAKGVRPIFPRNLGEYLDSSLLRMQLFAVATNKCNAYTLGDFKLRHTFHDGNARLSYSRLQHSSLAPGYHTPHLQTRGVGQSSGSLFRPFIFRLLEIFGDNTWRQTVYSMLRYSSAYPDLHLSQSALSFKQVFGVIPSSCLKPRTSPPERIPNLIR